MSECTWEGCKCEAEVDQEAEDGKIWARLCVEHSDILRGHLTSGSGTDIALAWIRARGGFLTRGRR